MAAEASIQLRHLDWRSVFEDLAGHGGLHFPFVYVEVGVHVLDVVAIFQVSTMRIICWACAPLSFT